LNRQHRMWISINIVIKQLGVTVQGNTLFNDWVIVIHVSMYIPIRSHKWKSL